MKIFKKFICGFVCLICLCFCMASFLPCSQNLSDTANAAVEEITETKTINFDVENNGDEISATNADLGQKNFESFAKAFEFMANSINEKEILLIAFNNFETNETLNIYQTSNLSEIVLSGSISGSENIFEISGENKLAIKCENLTLALLNETDYAFFVNNPAATLSFGKTINLANGYIANAGQHEITCHESVVAANKLKICVPAENNVIVLKNFTDGTLANNETDNFKFVTSADFYFFDTFIINNNVISKVYIKIAFDTNGGNYAEGFEPEEILSSNLSFPTSSELSLDHHDLVGWFGKLELSGETFYFDNSMLSAFIESETELSEIQNYFVKDLSEVNGEYSFFGNNSSDIVDLFSKFSQTPTFVAGWAESKYTISFNTNSDLVIDDLSLTFGENIVLPEPKRPGFEFLNWYTDSSLETEFELAEMPDHNISLFAKWEEKTFTLTFKDGETTISTISGNLGDKIIFPEIQDKTGFKFVGWFEDEEFNTAFENETLDSKDLTVFAKWQKNKYSIYVNSMGGDIYPPITVEYDLALSDVSIKIPVKTGYEFVGWFLDRNLSQEFDRTGTMPANNFTIYAKWNPLLFRLSFETNNNTSIISKTYYYGETIELPTLERMVGKTFVGWFEDQNLTSAFALKTMPSRSFTIYAKWADKQTITINGSVQTYSAQDINSSFIGFSNLSGFTVEYRIGNIWTINKPTEVGTYDVRISRSEDNNYKAFETIISGGFVLTGPELNLNWLIIVLFILSGIMFLAIVIIRWLIHLKKETTLAALVPFFSYMIPTSQLVLLIISGVLTLFMFIMLIYQIVVLSKTLPALEIKSENDRPDLTIADEGEDLADEKNKDIEVIGTKYSAKDIESLLVNDNFRQEHSKPKENKPEKVDDDKPYVSAVEISRQRSIDEKFKRDDLEEMVEVQDVNGQKEHVRTYSSELYEPEFDDWRNRTQSDIPDDAN